jgi:hypothetical protein
MKHFIVLIGFLICTNICFADSISKNKLITNQGEVVNNKVNDSKNDFNWNNLLSALLGGLIGLSPSIINYFRRSKIRGKIISQYANLGSTPKGEKGQIIFQKISIFSMYKNFFLKDIEIYVKFPNEPEIKCKNWTWRELIFTFPENERNIQKKLNIDKNEYLLHFSVFPKEQSVVGYISFSIDSLKDEKFEYVKYLFKDYKGHVKQLKIDKSEIIENTQLFDDSIWN